MTLQDLTQSQQLAVTGGDYVEETLGLMYGIAFGAGVVLTTSAASPFLLGGAIAVGGALLLYELYD
jgi:hypothetical protein